MDNLTNWWGKALIPDAPSSRRGATGVEEGDKLYYALENTVIMATTSDYRLDTCTPNGTLANSTAMHILSTKYFDSACTIMVASGSYVGGSGLGFQSDIMVRQSTTTLSPAGNLAFVKGPYDPTITAEARHCTCPLPYFIEANYDPDPNFIARYEEQCLDELHATCLLATLQQKPVRGILLELMLAGNGASLSDRTLLRLGKLASHHDFWFIVDEVMTGGRVDGSFLLVQQAPKEFQERVKYVTMGKWMGLGMVLSNTRSNPVNKTTASRGLTTTSQTMDANRLMKIVMQNQHHVAERRQQVLARLRVEPPDLAWGNGILIFAPVRNSGADGCLKQRFLPHITPTVIDMPKTNPRAVTITGKLECSLLVIEKVQEWIGFRKAMVHQPVSVPPRMLVDLLVRYSEQDKNHIPVRSIWMDFEETSRIPAGITRKKLREESGVKSALETGLLSSQQKGKKRERCYVLSGIFKFPKLW